MRRATRPGFAATAGYSLVELLVSMGMFTVIMGVTLSGLANVMKGNDIVMTISAINNSVRGGLDLMVRDLLQVGSGLPSSHSREHPEWRRIDAGAPAGPSGLGRISNRGRRPGVAGGDARAGAGPDINGVDTDVAVGADGRQRVPGRRS